MDTTLKEYEQAKSLIKTTGILSIIFGALGILIAITVMLVIQFDKQSFDGPDVFVGMIVIDSFIFLFGLLPHVFLLFSGIKLLQLPRPSIIKGLVITTLVISAFWNLVLLVFTIINLTQLKQYEEGLPKKHSA